MNRARAAAAALTLTALSTSAQAIEDKHEYSQRIQAAQAIAPLGSNLAGDEINYYNGSTSFSITDVELPGNSGLPVRVGRTFSTAQPEGPIFPALFGEWELDIPVMKGVFAASGTAWQVSTATPANRCSSPTGAYQQEPPAASTGNGTFGGDEYWRGNSLYVPGDGGQALLYRDPANTPAPTDGNTYKWVTNGNWQIRCGVTLQNGTGEGFMAVAPDGTKYRFDWMVTRTYSVLQRPMRCNGCVGMHQLNRLEVRIYPTRVEDRFGNSVTYSYTGEKLDWISASDGRLITLTYNGQNAIASVSAHGRTWNYTYSASRSLMSAVLPDGTSWGHGTAALIITYQPNYSGSLHCSELGIWSSGVTNKIFGFTHPGGATVQFEFAPTRHTRSVPYTCQIVEGLLEWGPSRQSDNYALVRKTISGPNLPTTQWTVSYSGPTTTVTNPDNSQTRMTFGKQYYVNEGKLLRTETLSLSGTLMRDENHNYILTSNYQAAPPGTPYAYWAGHTGMSNEDAFASVTRTPRTLGTIVQDGATFSTQTLLAQFDVFARPLQTRRWSTLSASYDKTDVVTYHDNTNLWVLGQTATVTSAGKVESRTDYTATALPWRTYSFDKLMQTFEWNANGTLWKVSNAAVPAETTTFSSWKRGIPQTVQNPDSTTRSAVVNDSGWITSVTDERGPGHTTSYGYDVMGRISSITHPQPDTVTWLNPTFAYEKLAASELGIAANSWRRQETLGNFRSRTYYDGRLRPILTEQMDTATGQAIYSRRNFDYDNREVFTSYPSSTYVASTGIESTYDALGRLTLKKTSDLITLQTVEYLTGSKKKVTDADGRSTTVSFQAFGAPDYGRAVLIEAELSQTTTITRDIFGKMTAVTQSGSYGAGTLTHTRTFEFDIYQRPCRRVDPESGSTVWGYDDASRVKWEARRPMRPCSPTTFVAG